MPSLLAKTSLERAANRFMTDLKNGDERAAYAMYSRDLQQQMNFEIFATAFNSVSVDDWDFTSRFVEDDFGRVSGTVTIDGRPVETTIFFVHTGTWKITAFDLSL